MTPKQYSKVLLRDNYAHVDKHIGGKHVQFIACMSAIVDVDVQMEANRKNEKEYLYFHETKTNLVKEFESYCILNKDLLKIPPNDKNNLRHDNK